MAYRLGVDVGGTFTDLLLVNERNGRTWSAKVSSTPADQSIGVLNGIARVCERAGIDPTAIDDVMHGTTVATNTVLTGTGARCGLVTTRGFRQVLQIARSFVPGGLGGWVIYNKTLPMAPLVSTVEATERVSARGEVVAPLDEDALRASLALLRKQNIEALTVSLINSFANSAHELRVREIARGTLYQESQVQPGADHAGGAPAHTALGRWPGLGPVLGRVSGQSTDVGTCRRRDRCAVGGAAIGLQEPADRRCRRYLDRRGPDPEWRAPAAS
jgi:N-methylhydantoinase A/oxoprolinase/acetone carboxylase beta subunit